MLQPRNEQMLMVTICFVVALKWSKNKIIRKKSPHLTRYYVKRWVIMNEQ